MLHHLRRLWYWYRYTRHDLYIPLRIEWFKEE